MGKSALSTSSLALHVGLWNRITPLHLLTEQSGDIDTISKRFDDNSQNTTVLAPLNSELRKLPRKPWEDPKDYHALGAEAYEGSEGEDRAHKNLRRFTEAHVVPVSPWKEGERVKTVAGNEVWWEEKEGSKRVCSGYAVVLIYYERTEY